MHCLLYLNRDTFISEAESHEMLDEHSADFALSSRKTRSRRQISKKSARSTGGVSASGQPSPTASTVRWALQQGETVRMVLVHEQDPSKGGCPVRRPRIERGTFTALPAPCHELKVARSIRGRRSFGGSSK